MHVHILGICGKLMSGIALIAKQKGFKVTGSDENLQTPTAKMLQDFDITVHQGYQPANLDKDVEGVIIGNALSRGRPLIEYILNNGIRYHSGPQWLFEEILKNKWVLAVSGTHGKTTTTSMLTFILEIAGYNPGYLIGGNPLNLDFSARWTDSKFFVIEADEYDTAFFDKRSKFIHYAPKTLVINNLEFDHADIFSSLEDIKKQFFNLLKIVPSNGLIIAPQEDANVQSLFIDHAWTPRVTFGNNTADWSAHKLKEDGSEFLISFDRTCVGKISWHLLGEHNIQNALAALAAAQHVGVNPALAIKALNDFQGVKRRLELKGVVRKISLYDDFAHHPSAIKTTLAGLRRHVGQERITTVLEFASNTMREGLHNNISQAFQDADQVVLLRPKNIAWDIDRLAKEIKQPVNLFDTVDEIVNYLVASSQANDHILCMSNLNFDGIHQKLLEKLA